MTRSKSKLSSVVGSGRAGQLRRRTQPAKPSGGVSKQAIRRLARRAGVKRMSEGIYTEAPLALRAWLSAIVKDAVVYADHARRFTLTVNDIILALKRNGSTLYGYTYYEKRERLTRKLPASALAGKPAANEAASGVRKASTAETPSRAANLADGPAPAAPTAAGVVEQTPKGVSKSNPKLQTKMTGGARVRKGSRLGGAGPNKATPSTSTPGTRQERSASGNRVTPERAQDIQRSLSTFRDTVIERQKDSCTTAERMQDWVAAHMLGRGVAPCTPVEMDAVIGALVERDVVFRADGKLFFV